MKKILILFLIVLLTGCAGSAPLLNIPPQQPPPPQKFKHPRVVLVLGSGGARGYAHLGVLQALQEAHIPIDAIVGASAGGIIAALYADNHSYKKTYDIMMHANFWSFADISSSPQKGIIKGYHLEKFLLTHMQARTFAQLHTRLILSTTDLATGQPYAIQSGPIAPAVLASAALPGAVQPVQLYGRVLVDGGVANPVPVSLAKPFAPTLIIAVNISQIEHHPDSTAIQVYNDASDIMWQRLTDYSLQGATMVIHPDVGNIGTFNLDKKYQLYLAGLKATRKMIPEIKRLLHQ